MIAAIRRITNAIPPIAQIPFGEERIHQNLFKLFVHISFSLRKSEAIVTNDLHSIYGSQRCSVDMIAYQFSHFEDKV